MKINVKETMSKIVKVDNSIDKEREFDIEAQVNIEHSNVVSLSDIIVRTKEDSRAVAQLNYMGTSLSGQLKGDSEHPNDEIVKAVEAFVNDVKEMEVGE